MTPKDIRVFLEANYARSRAASSHRHQRLLSPELRLRGDF